MRLGRAVMLALTLWQPWAWAILHLPPDIRKPVENRDWKPPAKVIGSRIALHGGLKYDGGARHTIAGAGGIDAYTRHGNDLRRRHTGILATVRVPGVVEKRGGELVLVAGEWGDVRRHECVPWFVGRYGWLIDQVALLEQPVPCRGLQKLWTVPDDIAAMLP